MRFSLPAADPARFFCDVYCETTAPLRDPAAFAAAYDALPPFRRKRADAYRRPGDRLRSVAAFRLLQRALAEHGVPHLDDGCLVFNEHGKPGLSSVGPEFNLSHSGEWVMVAVASRPVGVDIQCDDGRALDGLARTVLSPAELVAFYALPPALREEFFYARWTAKESYLKCVGSGISVDLRTLEFSGTGIAGVPVHLFRPHPGVHAAVAVAANSGK